MANNNHWCFAWMRPKAKNEAEKAALVKAAKWNANDSIRIAFLDGIPSVQNRVKQVAKEWVGNNMANLNFEFLNNPNNADIRISFRYPGSWSTVGTESRLVTDKTQPTMNYGWLHEDSDDDELRRVVLHEFGHALGLVHEHQNPNGGIQWNRDQVVEDLSGPPNNWSLDVIEHNMFTPYDNNETNSTSFDEDSIMLYPIPIEWTTNGFSVGLNNGLSAKDKQFIREQYPLA